MIKRAMLFQVPLQDPFRSQEARWGSKKLGVSPFIKGELLACDQAPCMKVRAIQK